MDGITRKHKAELHFSNNVTSREVLYQLLHTNGEQKHSNIVTNIMQYKHLLHWLALITRISLWQSIDY